MTAPILILDAHPDPDSLCASLASAYARGASAHALTKLIRLVDLQFDPILRRGHRADQPWEPDLQAAADAIYGARHIAIVYPTWWAGPPALLKGFIERVFLPGWSYKFDGSSPLPTPLLSGRSARIITTMDSPGWWYRLMHARAGHAMLVRPTLHFVGVKPVAESTLYAVRAMSPDAIRQHITKIERTGAQDALRLGEPQSFLKKISSMA